MQARPRRRLPRFGPTASHCLELGVIDAVVAEPAAGAHTDHDAAGALLGDALDLALKDAASVDASTRRVQRREKFRAMGTFTQ